MSALEKTFLAPTAAVRSYLVLRGALLLLAADVWMTLLGPAWRYGVAGFSVPHFAWMSGLPIVTSAAYVGGIALVSGLSLALALSPRPPRWMIGVVAALYTWGWASSMLDSYQHHYLLSWVLVSFVGYPQADAAAMFGPATAIEPTTWPHGKEPLTHAWGPKLTWILCAVVYAYTALSKTEPDWWNGDALRNITHGGEEIEGFVAFFARLGIEGDAFWEMLGRSTVAIQVVCSLGYAAALVRDATPASTLRSVLDGLAWIALVAAVSFHLGAEVMGLEIGWFSWYMVLLALATFLPARVLGLVVSALTTPTRGVPRDGAGPAPAMLGVGYVVVAVLAAAAAGAADLPGVIGGTAVYAAIVLGVVLVSIRAAKTSAAAAAIASFGLYAALMLLCLQLGAERYDYWRFAGGDFRRRGETEAALEAYRHAVLHAPLHGDDEEDEGSETPRARMERRVRELEATLAEDATE